jgi:4-hydroxy-tetrahydrodipicolinate synthase
MTNQAKFGAVGCAMVTPFDAELRLDVKAAADLARWLCVHGNDFLVVSGTTGESPSLSDDEKKQLWEAVASAVDVPVLAGTSTSDTAHSVELTRLAAGCGVSGVLAVTPYYNRPSQAGIEAHFRAIGAAAGGLPVIAYDIPVRTGRKIDPEVLLRLAADGVIAGVKDATASPAGTAELIAQAPEGFEVYSGNDADTLSLLAVGAVGVISVESHWAGAIVSDMVAAFAKGDVDTARALNARLIASHRFQSSDDAPNPVPAKAALRALGHPVGQCRPPMGEAPPGLDEAAGRLLETLRG